MKNNLISAIAGWKSTALLALIAMVAAVAFSGVLTSTQSADAQTGTNDDPVLGSPGETVKVTFTQASSDTDTYRFRIASDSTGSATFPNGATALSCIGSKCDADGAATDGVTLSIVIDDDSPLGEIFVERYVRNSSDPPDTQYIRVEAANPPVALKAYGAPPAAAKTANPTAAEIGDNSAFVTISAQLVNARGKGIAGTSTILVTTTRGILNSGHNGENPACTDVSACTLTTQAEVEDDTGTTDVNEFRAAGHVTVTLRGNGSTGTAEVVFRDLTSGLTHEASVVLHGPAASISAAADQGTIGVGGSTFIVVTIVDADGNPAVGAEAGVQTNDPQKPSPITGPEVPAGSSANLVLTPVNVNKDPAGVANDIPSCGAHVTPATVAAPEADPPVAAVAASSSTGTNTAGKCVIQVNAPDEAGKASDATRGTHTITIGTANVRIATVNVEVQVGGVPATIDTSAAPARVDSLSSTSITITVLDDEGVRVGSVPVSVVQVEGSGNTDKPAGGDAAMTSDGRASFTFLAPLSEGEAVFLIRAGNAAAGQQIQSTITLAIGAEAEEAPDAPPATWNDELVSGAQNVVWNGDDDAAVADGAAEGVTAIWQWNGTGWDGYFPAAADVPGGNTLATLSNGAAYWVIAD